MARLSAASAGHGAARRRPCGVVGRRSALANPFQHPPPPPCPACPLPQKALTDLGISLPSEGHCVSQGSVRHSRTGKVSISRERGNVTFSRAGLAQFLIDEVWGGAREEA
jgi:hypothetical protein